MYGKLSIRYLVPMLLAALIGCQQAEEVSPVTPDSPREPASLVLTSDFSALIASASRTNDADDNTIRHVSLFLINYLENRLVAYRNIYPDEQASLSTYDDRDAENGFVNEATGKVDPALTSGKVVRVTFNYNDPKHGLAEKLTRGSYVLLAVANYSESDQFGKSGIAQQIRNLTERFQQTPATGISNFRQECGNFYDLVLQIPVKTDQNNQQYAPYVRPGSVSIPLSTTQTLNLISGSNRMSAELKHTCARVKIDICNYSELPLTVEELSMSDNFTQSACYLFSRANGENYTDEVANANSGKGAPVTTDANALVPFVENTVVTKNMGVTTLFDGLIYESRDEVNNYTYTIGVNYGNKDLTRYELKNDGQPVTSLYNMQAQGPYFLIKRSDADSYLYDQNDAVYASSGSNTPQQILDQCAANNYYYNYVWELVWDGSSSGYYLRNVQTGKYIEEITSTSEYYRLKTVDRTSSADTFNVSGSYGNFNFRSTSYYNAWSWSSRYAYIYYNWNNGVVCGQGSGSNFMLYPVEQVSGLGTREQVILRTIDKTSGVVSDVHEIQRNDFIRVLVEVSYNPDKGDFEFYVNDWEIGGGEITFN
uniref:hypothetical protein n=1 Tax=Alistipes megaguti TaxID=2364787 RepID=UPI000EFAC91D|nr:hypothetical protein [Alistipes megaguti]